MKSSRTPIEMKRAVHPNGKEVARRLAQIGGEIDQAVPSEAQRPRLKAHIHFMAIYDQDSRVPDIGLVDQFVSSLSVAAFT